MVKILPIDNDGPAFRVTVTLDGVVCQYRLVWSSRIGRWALDVMTPQGDPILVGRKVLPGRPIFYRTRDDRLPPGELFVIDRSGTGEPPGRNELGRGKRVRLEYVEAGQ